MPARAAVFIATSLDGFIARQDGSIDWLDEASASQPEGEDCGYGNFMAGIDAIVMGRKTFEQVLGFGAWPYGQTELVVMSRQGVAIPSELAGTVSSSAEPPATIAQRLAERGKRRLYVDGGQVIQSFLAAGLVDEITITIIPVVLGSGIPLFTELEAPLGLRLIGTEVYHGGLVQLRYGLEEPEG